MSERGDALSRNAHTISLSASMEGRISFVDMERNLGAFEEALGQGQAGDAGADNEDRRRRHDLIMPSD